MSSPNDNLRGAALMAISMGGYVLNDMFMQLSGRNISLGQAMLIRGIAITLLVGCIAYRRGVTLNPLRYRNRALHVRVAADLAATLMFLTALFHMPLANATAILQVVPLMITLSAALLFGERVGWRRYLSISAGFVGVLCIVRPGSEGFNTYALLALAAMAAIVVRDLATQKVSSEVPSLFMAYLTALVITLCAALLAAFTPWKAVQLIDLAYLTGAAGFLFFGYLGGIMTMRIGDVSFVAPFRYSIMIWALLIDTFVFAIVPDRWTLTGSAIIVGAGVYAFHRQRRQYSSKSS